MLRQLLAQTDPGAIMKTMEAAGQMTFVLADGPDRAGPGGSPGPAPGERGLDGRPGPLGGGRALDRDDA